MNPRHWLSVLASCLLPFALLAAETMEDRVITTDGREIIGKLSRNGDVTVVNTGIKEVHLSPAIIAKTDQVPARETSVVYEFNKELVAGPKKGKIGLVITEARWGAPTAEGKIPVTLTDPKLGKVSMTWAITKITPTMVQVEGIEYTHQLGFALRDFQAGILPLMRSVIDPEKKDSVLKAVRFFQQTGDFQAASLLLDDLVRREPNDEQVKRVRVGLTIAQYRHTLREANTLVQCQRHAAAAELLKGLEALPALPETEQGLVQEAKKRGDAIQQQLALVMKMTELLKEKGAAVEELTVLQAERLERILKPGMPNAPSPPAKYLPLLKDAWAEPLASMPWTNALLEEAATLAEETAGFFAQEKPEGLEKLAARFEEAKLPQDLKVSILQHARKLPAPPKPFTAEKVDFKHPESKKDFHYYVKLPESYRPDVPTPALICLHGMNSKPDVMFGMWGPLAEKLGLILISPEYIYGREAGYRFSAEENQAVAGALRHASGRFNIDRDRVFLQGHSQGGHACWDMGGSLAGELAGVIPVIGCHFDRRVLANFKDTAVYAIDGSLDGDAPKFNRLTMPELAKLKCDATYVEFIGRGHDAFVEEYDEVGRWMLQHRRDPGRKELNLVAMRECDLRRNGIAILSMATALPAEALPSLAVNPPPRPMSRVQGTWDKNQFRAATANVREMRVCFPAALVDYGKDVQIVVNGFNVFRGKVKPNWTFALRSSFERRDRDEVFLGETTVKVR